MTRFFKNRNWLLFLVISVIVAASFMLASKRISFSGDNKDAGVGIVKKEDLIQRVTIAGTVIPNRRTIVTAPYHGYVQKLFVKIGDKVRQGDPIVSIAQSLQSSDTVYPLRAPFSGIVVQVEKSEGEFVKEGEAKEFIVRIDDLGKIFILANVPEIDRVKIKAGQEAIIKASAILTRSYKGVIRELSLAAKEKEQWGRSQVEFPIRIEVLDHDEQLSPGMSVVIDIITNKKERVLTLKHEFIHKEAKSSPKNSGEQYFVILKNGNKQPIEAGTQNEEVFEVKSGLKEGDQVQQVDFSAIIQSTQE